TGLRSPGDEATGFRLRRGIAERLPGTTAVLESCFGKRRASESCQSMSGFIGLVDERQSKIAQLSFTASASTFRKAQRYLASDKGKL
ncbi:MAG TPA: hypothetical protein VEI52_02150, partial [Terriglobales bacterium]|nr:hypothetical protein [Terriglobales bacterium]